MLVEFAIALPLLILILYALGLVSVNIFRLSRDQLADYVLESEARYAMERITYVARAAKAIEINGNYHIKIVHHSVKDLKDTTDNGYYPKDLAINSTAPFARYFMDRDVWETQIFVATPAKDRDYKYIYAQHQENVRNNPITGANFFGDTQVLSMKFSELNEKVLRIELEMESRLTKHKIKIATAVFMPGLEKLEITQ